MFHVGLENNGPHKGIEMKERQTLKEIVTLGKDAAGKKVEDTGP